MSSQSKESAPQVLRGQTEGDFTIADFHFKSGEVLPELRLHYVTLGTPHRNSAGIIDNAVLILHPTGGSGAGVLSHLKGPLFGPGEAFDLTQWYLVLPDSIGHGNPASPATGCAHTSHGTATKTWWLHSTGL
jgi:homoserine O-acetyltransferase